MYMEHNMSKPITVNHDLATGEITEREMTDAEYADYQILCNKIDEVKAEAQVKAQAKAVLLERLGLTQEEFNTLTAQS